MKNYVKKSIVYLIGYLTKRVNTTSSHGMVNLLQCKYTLNT